MEVDFSGAIEFEALVGKFPATLISAEAGVSKKGAPKITWVFMLDTGKPGTWKRTRHTPTTGKGSGLTKQVLKAFGIDLKPGERLRLKPLIDKPCTVVMKVQADNDEYDEIDKVLPPAAPASQLA